MARILTETFETYNLGDLDGQGTWVTQYSEVAKTNPQYHVVDTPTLSGTKSVQLYDTGGAKSYSEITQPLLRAIQVGEIGFEVYVPTNAPVANQIGLDFFSGPVNIVTYDTWSLGIVFSDSPSDPVIEMTLYDNLNPVGFPMNTQAPLDTKVAGRIVLHADGTFGVVLGGYLVIDSRVPFTGNEAINRYGFSNAGAMPAVLVSFDNLTFADNRSPLPTFFQIP